MNVTTVGIDLAKNVFSVHGVDAHGKPVLKNNQMGSASQLFSFMHHQRFAGDLDKPGGCEGCFDPVQISAENFLQFGVGNVAG